MFHDSAQSSAGATKCSPFLQRILTGTRSYQSADTTEMDRKPRYLLTFSDKAGMYFPNLLNMAFLICHHDISSPCFPWGEECHTLGLFLRVDISLAVGPMSCSPSENAKTLAKGLLTPPLLAGFRAPESRAHPLACSSYRHSPLP